MPLRRAHPFAHFTTAWPAAPQSHVEVDIRRHSELVMRPLHYPRVMSTAAILLALSTALPAFAGRITLATPAGSGAFGASVTALPNRNIVVTDPGFDDPETGIQNVGAVYLFNDSGALISTLRGSMANDAIGGRIVVLSNGNYVVASSVWGSNHQGAATFCRADIGCNGVVSAANSLVGSQTNDGVGTEDKIFPLSNGNYLVISSVWDDGVIVNAGAVTWGSGVSGISGAVSVANSLVGSSAGDAIGNGGMLALSNGNYVVISPKWDDTSNGLVNTGAVTFGDGSTGSTGQVSTTNSFTTGMANPSITLLQADALASGNYVIRQPNWKNGSVTNAGAVTFASGTNGLTGSPNLGNSLVGSHAGDGVGAEFTALANGNYVVRSADWSDGRGAVTFGDGTLGITGVVSAGNSLVGGSPADRVGTYLYELSNANYVTTTAFWDSPVAINVGAVTFGSGISGVSGLVSASNSLVGSVANDQLGVVVIALTNGNYVITCQSCDLDGIVDNGVAIFAPGDGSNIGVLTAAMAFMAGETGTDQIKVTALSNGNYVVANRLWDDGAIVNVGAITFANGTTGITGLATPGNSLIGSSANDRVGTSITALSNGNYVVQSTGWRNGTEANVGAVTLGSGISGSVGVVSAANSLVGSTRNDAVGSKVVALTNGNYVVSSYFWNNGTVVDAGASTWGSGTSGVVGPVTPANSFVGTRTDDQIGVVQFLGGAITALADGNYVMRSQYLNTASIADAGANTLGLGDGLTMQPGVLSLSDLAGPLTTRNSVIGGIMGSAGTGFETRFAYNASPKPHERQLIVGLPRENSVVLLSYDGIFQNSFE